MTLKTKDTATPSTTAKKLLKHIVELKNGQPTDKCLCGYIWDRVFLPLDGELCQECADEVKRRHG